MHVVVARSLQLLLLTSLAAHGTACDPVDTPDAPDAAVIECPAPTSGPTMHHGDVDVDEVWTADGSPHIVDYDVTVRDGHTLTIEPCARVQFAAGKGMSIAAPITPNTGSLVAEGTPQRPIWFERLEAEHWSNIYVVAPGTARLAYVELSGGGGGGYEDSATLVAVGNGVLPADPILKLDHVRIADSVGTGVWIRNGANFIAGSQDLTITGSGSEEFPFPAQIDEHSMDAFPTGSYTGNRIDEVLLQTTGVGIAGVGLTVDATLHDRGVPYRMGGSFYLGGMEGAPLATMTIEPGVVMRFPKDTALFVEKFTGIESAQAALRAIGTAAKPIVFTSAEDAPVAGDWMGLWFGQTPSAKNRIDFARIEYAGGECLCSLSTCSQTEQSEGAVILTSRPPTAFITNTVFMHSAQHGVTQGFVGSTLDFRATNTFDDVAGCAQTLPHPDAPLGCPDPAPLCD